MLRKFYIITTIASLSFLTSFAQQRVCATDQAHERLMASDAAYRNNRQKLEHFTAHESNNLQRNNLTVTIPVVFHILYNVNNSTQNISTNRILDQLQVLNDDFTAMNNDLNLVPSVFQSVIGNADIQFCLAQRDPNGNATDGILRISTSTSSFSTNDNIKFTSSGGSDAWPRDEYLNIWVSNLSNNLLGYAQYPGGPANTDGVVLLNASVGGPNFPGTATNYDIGRTATHEVGHWLNLLHIWGNGTCGNDQVADTPTQETSNFSCPTFPHVTCSNGPNGDMFMNYMDYVDDACMVMFSAGQATRMNAAISGARSGLITSLGCVAPAAAPVAAFEASTTDPCKYDQVTFTDLSSNSPTSWSWTFPGGTPSTSNLQNPVITYNNVGTYNVSLTVTNASGSDSETLTGFITVNGLPQVTITSAGNATTVCAGSSLTLTANSQSNTHNYQWMRYSIPIPGATSQTYDVTRTGNYKVMVTKSNGCSKTTGNFRVDRLPFPSAVTIAPDGPTTFCQGDSVTLTATSNPNYTYNWKRYSNILNETGTSLVVHDLGAYKAIVTDANGCQRASNKIIVDVNCRITEAANFIKIYPNPASEYLTIDFNTPVDITSDIAVYDALGRKTMQTQINAGEKVITLNLSALPKGIYLIRVEGKEQMSKSILIN